jgi:alpha-methylacyl-CoA racemase
MVDGVSSLLSMFYGLRAAGLWRDARGSNLLDGGAPFYDTYRCADGGYVAVGALEPQFWAVLVATLELDDLPAQHDTARWPELRQRLAETFASRTRDQWAGVFEGLDACVAPVLTLGEAAQHPHLAARGVVVEQDGVPQPAAAPRFSRTPSAPGGTPPSPGADTRTALADWGFADDEISSLLDDGAVVSA